MHEGTALSRHDIFIPATQEEGGLAKRPAERLLDPHEAVIAVDHHPRPVGPPDRGDARDVDQRPRSEHQLRHEQQVVIRRRCDHLRGQLARHRQPGDDRLARFLPPRELAPRAVEFAFGRQHAQRLPAAPRTGRRQPDQQVVGIAGEHHRAGVGGAKLIGDMALRLGPDLAHDPVPFAIGQPRGIVPRLDLPRKAGVGPQMMAVRRQVEPPRCRGQAFGEQAF